MAGDALVSESMGNPGAILSKQPARRHQPARGDARRGREAHRVLIDVRRVRRARAHAARRTHGDPPDQPVRRIEAGVRARARLVSSRARAQGGRAALLQRRRRRLALGRAPRAGDASHSARVSRRRPARGRTSRSSATTIRLATARACATTSTCSTWPTHTCWRWISCAAASRQMEIYNLGCGGEGYTNREVVTCAEKVTGKRIATAAGPRRAGDPPVLVASSDKARRELGWKPRRERLDVIIESAWKWKRAQGPQP